MPQNSTTLSLKYLRRVQSLEAAEKNGSYLENESSTEKPLSMSSLIKPSNNDQLSPKVPPKTLTTFPTVVKATTTVNSVLISSTTANTITTNAPSKVNSVAPFGNINAPVSSPRSMFGTSNVLPVQKSIFAQSISNVPNSFGFGEKESKPCFETKPSIKPLTEKVPEQIQNSMEDLKKFIRKEQKFKMEIASNYSKINGNFINDIMFVKNKISKLSSKLFENKKISESLKQENTKEIECFKQIALAIRFPNDYPYFNVLADTYFQNFMEKCENCLVTYQYYVEEIHNRLLDDPVIGASIKAEDLVEIILRVYQSFVTVASGLHICHSKVESIKHKYRDYINQNVTKSITENSQTRR